MTDIFKMHGSDVANMYANKIAINDSGTDDIGYEVVWSNRDEVTILLGKTSTEENMNWMVAKCLQDNIKYNADTGKFDMSYSDLQKVGTKKLTKEDMETAPNVLKKLYNRIYNGSKNEIFSEEQGRLLVEKDVVDGWEKQFYNECIVPYIESHELYSIGEGGFLLAKRLKVQTHELFIEHYDNETDRDDYSLGDLALFNLPEDTDKPILIIDDMVSSGRTAKAVIDAFEQSGYNNIRFTALYEVCASIEVPEILPKITTFKQVTNHYWFYGRGLDLCAYKSRKLKDLWGTEKIHTLAYNPDDETEEDINDLLNFFNI